MQFIAHREEKVLLSFECQSWSLFFELDRGLAYDHLSVGEEVIFASATTAYDACGISTRSMV